MVSMKKKNQNKRKKAEKEADRGGEKRCRSSSSSVTSIHLPTTRKEDSGVGQQNVRTESTTNPNIPRKNDGEAEVAEDVSN